VTTEHGTHPSPAQYWKIAALLAVLTAFEVAMFYLDRELGLGALNALILISLALLKFVIVVGWYMHLRFENALPSRFFTAGAILAISLYLVLLSAMGTIIIRG
jgi:cytochrome c oxidase subunit IV